MRDQKGMSAGSRVGHGGRLVGAGGSVTHLNEGQRELSGGGDWMSMLGRGGGQGGLAAGAERVGEGWRGGVKR